MKIQISIQFVVGGLCFLAASCQAQDVGENGANRRVSTVGNANVPRYGGVRGTFSEPKFNDPFNDVQRENIDTPQMYVGTRAPMEVDTGLTWIPVIGPDGSPNTDSNNWTLFFRGLGIPYRQPKKFGEPLLLAERNTLGRVTIELSIRPRLDGLGSSDAGAVDGRNEAVLNITKDGVVFNPQPFPIPNMSVLPTVANPPDIQVKRVIAITQNAKFANGTRVSQANPETPGMRAAFRAYLDDSFLENAEFSAGEVRALRVNQSGTLEAYGNWLNWDNVGGDGNHFFPWGRYGQALNATAATPTRDPNMPWVIAPRPPHTRYQAPGAQLGKPASPATLFNSETVDIHMYRQRPVRANAVAPAGN